MEASRGSVLVADGGVYLCPRLGEWFGCKVIPMSRTKDFFFGGECYSGGHGRWGGGSRLNWVDVSPRRRCPVCESDSWCQIARDGATVLCKRIAGDVEKTNRHGVTYHVHHTVGERPRMQDATTPTPQRTRAPTEVCDRAYRAVLEQLRLDEGDHRDLEARGLDAEAIRVGAYRSLRVEGRTRLARAVVDAIGEEAAATVPGIVWHTEGRDGWWSLAGAPGLVVPVRDAEGRIAALKVRRRGSCDGPRYVYLSSARYGGASAVSAVHVPLAAQALRGDGSRLILTEGELKSDVATHLARAPVVSVPGVGSWAAGVELAKSWGARLVAVAFDMDATKSVHVAGARRRLCERLRDEGLDVRLWRWDPRHKGIDDILLARRTKVQCHAR